MHGVVSLPNKVFDTVNFAFNKKNIHCGLRMPGVSFQFINMTAYLPPTEKVINDKLNEI